MSGHGSIAKLRREHILERFDCGKEELNDFIKRRAWNDQQANSAQTYVLAQELVVSAYYSLTAGAVIHEAATERVKKGLARYPIPVILLARLAVDRSLQGRGVGPAQLKDALLRAAGAADTIGARAVLVHAQDNAAKGFYEHFDFEPSPSDPYHLLLIMKDVKRILSFV